MPATARAYEAGDADAPASRAAAGAAAGREVLQDRLALERDGVATLLKRLTQLKRELLGILNAAGASEFRKFTASSLVAEIDGLIADATADMSASTRATFHQALDIGTNAVDAPISGARIAIGGAPQLDRTLVTHAFDNTVDLLSEPMRQFRNQVVQGVRRAATAGESSYTEIRKLSASIEKQGFDAAAFKAERIVRTQLSRVLNGATFDRLAALAGDMPFLRKGWRASKDNRTRRGHAEAGKQYQRGQGIPIAEPFRVNVYQEFPGKAVTKLIGVALLRFPSDPETTPGGRIAAGATILCRCNAFVDFNLAELDAFSTSRSKTVTVPGPGPVPLDTPIVPPVVPREPRPRTPKTPMTAERARAKLETLATRTTAKASELRRRYRDANQAVDERLMAMYRVAADDPARAELSRLYDEAKALQRALAIEVDKATAIAARRARAILAVEKTRTLEITPEFPSPTTSFASGKSRRAIVASQQKVRDVLTDIGRLLDRDLSVGRLTVDRAKNYGTGAYERRAFAVDSAEMAGRYRSPNSINIDKEPTPDIIAHELGHILEFNNPSVREAALQFLERRTHGEPARTLNALTGTRGYGPWEVARKDKFIEPYIGKDYGAARYTEIVSKGLEYFYREPARLAREDPDMFDFIFHLLRGQAGKP